MPTIRERLLHRLGLATEPEYVEKASDRERLRRWVWMIGSTVISFGFVGVAFKLAFLVEGTNTVEGADWLVLAVVMIALAVVLDMRYVFPWGVERFDLVAPWEFRDAAAENGPYSVVVSGPEDHDRATSELALAIAGEVDDAIAEHGHPVTVTVSVEVDADE